MDRFGCSAEPAAFCRQCGKFWVLVFARELDCWLGTRVGFLLSAGEDRVLGGLLETMGAGAGKSDVMRILWGTSGLLVPKAVT